MIGICGEVRPSTSSVMLDARLAFELGGRIENRRRYHGSFRRDQDRMNLIGFVLCMTLSDVYTKIAQQASGTTDWPQNDGFRSLLHADANDALHPPRFDDGHGPIGVYALLNDNDGFRTVLKRCTEAFDEFCRDGKCRHVYRPDPSTHHICVTVFHEHPSLLQDPDVQKLWKPVAAETELKLAEAVHASLPSRPVPLRLDRLLFTPDGALIAGFVGDDFRSLRSSVAAAGRDVLGDLTSRPKSLIHVTIGRILDTAVAIDTQHMIPEYHQQHFPALVDSLQGIELWVRDVALLREKVWMLNEYRTIRTWRLEST